MGRNNKLTETVFGNIIGSETRFNLFEKFLSLDTRLGIHISKDLVFFKKKYSDLIKNLKDDFDTLAKIEEIIIQLRSKELISENIRLTPSHGYIYARSTFYRLENEFKDIRVVVGRCDVYGTDASVLLSNERIMAVARTKLEKSMGKHINKNIEIIKNKLK